MKVMKEINNINIWKPYEFWLNSKTYSKQVEQLLLEVYQKDNTVLTRSADHLKKYFDYSVIAQNKSGELVWHWACFPTNTYPRNIKIWNNSFSVWENWSIVIHPDLQGKWIWTQLAQHIQDTVDDRFDIVVGGTISESMHKIRGKLGYTEIPFSSQLLNEWKQFFAPIIWEKEFLNRAKCNALIPESLIEQKELIIQLLNNS